MGILLWSLVELSVATQLMTAILFNSKGVAFMSPFSSMPDHWQACSWAYPIQTSRAALNFSQWPCYTQTMTFPQPSPRLLVLTFSRNLEQMSCLWLRIQKSFVPRSFATMSVYLYSPHFNFKQMVTKLTRLALNSIYNPGKTWIWDPPNIIS